MLEKWGSVDDKAIQRPLTRCDIYWKERETKCMKMGPYNQRPKFGKSILWVPDTGTCVLDKTRPFLCPSIVGFWTALACSKERKYHIFMQYWYTGNVPVFAHTGTFQYLWPEVYFFPKFFWKWNRIFFFLH